MAFPDRADLLEIRFRTRQLQRLCNSRKELQRGFGGLANVIELRLQLLGAAKHLGQVPHSPPVHRHQLTGSRSGQFAVSLRNPHRLVFRPDHDPVPVRPDGGIDVSAVTAIEIIEITDYH
jgi:plasmid maintenance system killer protein